MWKLWDFITSITIPQKMLRESLRLEKNYLHKGMKRTRTGEYVAGYKRQTNFLLLNLLKR